MVEVPHFGRYLVGVLVMVTGVLVPLILGMLKFRRTPVRQIARA